MKNEKKKNNCQKTTLSHWSKDEMKNLLILFYMGATTKEITDLIQRTPQSIEKKIDRLRLKPKSTCTHLLSIKRHIPESLPSMERRNLIFDISSRIQVTSLSDITAALQKTFPLKREPKQNKRQKETDALTKSKEQWKSLTEIVGFLEKNKGRVRTLNDYSNQLHGFTHAIGNRRHSPSTLLREANIIQHEENKQIFYVTNTTEE